MAGDEQHAAAQVINSLAEASDITEERAHEAKRQYEALHAAVLAAMAAETARLTDAKVLKQRLDEQAAQAAADPATGSLGPDVRHRPRLLRLCDWACSSNLVAHVAGCPIRKQSDVNGIVHPCASIGVEASLACQRFENKHGASR